MPQAHHVPRSREHIMPLSGGFFQLQHTGLLQPLAQQGAQQAGDHDLGQVPDDANKGLDASSMYYI